MVWGAYIEENCPSSNGHLLDFGGVKMLARMVWGTFLEKDLATIQNGRIGPEKSATECPFECGEGGGPSAIWAMPK